MSVCLLISVKISLHLLKLWASERFTLQKDVRNAHSLKDGFVFSNQGVKCNLLSYQNSGVHVLVSGHRRWTAVLHLLCFQCSSDRAWEKTAEVRNWDWNTGKKDIGKVLYSRKGLWLGLEIWQRRDLRCLLPKVEHAVGNSNWQFKNWILQENNPQKISDSGFEAELGWCAVICEPPTSRKKDLKCICSIDPVENCYVSM